MKRYLKEIDSTRDFAISKFAKEMLDVRDNLERASEHILSFKVDDNTKIEDLKAQFE